MGCEIFDKASVAFLFRLSIVSTFDIAHLSKIVVNFIFIMMSKPKYIVILTDFYFVA